jgi:hypothetical protein
MNLIEFNNILSRPGQIKKEQINELSAIIEEYPYFQVAHFLHLNGLKNQRSFKYNDYLKKTAAYTTDRSVLFDYITSDDFDIHPAPADILTLEPETKTAVVSSETEEPSIKEPEATLKIGEPLLFKKDESYSFREWLQLSHLEPIERPASEQKISDTSVKSDKNEGGRLKTNMELIDHFIAKNPKISSSLLDTYSDATMDSVTENESLMTETLAHVYVEQKKYEKAITAFTVLSLKYPEKSSFFALQIEAIKKLQEK